MNINKTHLCGNLTRDPEVRDVGQSKVAKVTIAINRTWKDAQGEKKEECTFVDCEAWGRTAELIGQYCTKGSELYVEGRLKLDTWEKDGQKHSKIKVVIENMQFGRKPGGAGDSAPRAATAQAQAPASAATSAGGGGGGQDEPPFARSELELLP